MKPAISAFGLPASISPGRSRRGHAGGPPALQQARCCDPFPFPNAIQAARAALAEELDALRRTRLDAHPLLTMTGLYNVLDALRAGQTLTPAERGIHDSGQVSIPRRLHDALDAAVAAAYGWPADLPAPAVVARIVALNLARQAEEADGTVRWLRPTFQAPAEAPRPAKPALALATAEDALPPWPAQDLARYVALRTALATAPGRPAHLSRRFARASPAKVSEMLKVLATLGQARLGEDGRYHG